MKFGITILFAVSLFAAQVIAQETPLQFANTMGDHMVLQQGQTTHIWGTGKASADLSLTFAGKTQTAKADEAGNWAIPIGPFETSNESRQLTVTSGEDTITLNDVLVGEVWMCSGQSNMQWRLEITENGKEEAATANHPNVRLFSTPNQTAIEEQSDVTGGSWQICSPESAAKFSAVGYYFGKELANALGDTPIGLINTAWGGKPVEAFTSKETLADTAGATRLVAEWQKADQGFDAEKAEEKYNKALAAYNEKRNRLKAEGKKVSLRRPKLSTRPLLQPNAPSAIYHQMIAPWRTYAIRGAIWYQGESNQYRAEQYQSLFPAMITDWRKQWNQPDLPFYFVQLANFKAASTVPGSPSPWAELQNTQTMTLKLPHTGMAIINDIGAANDIHPRNKQDVGKRLARWALAKDYGKPISPISGPIMASHQIDGQSIIVTFDHVGEGLKSRDGEDLKRFEIAGEDQKWIWASATINEDGKSVTISHPEVTKPVAARYAWAANPEGANLVNSAGLPTSLFRTDNFPLFTKGSETTAQSGILRNNETLAKKGMTVLFNGINTDGWHNPYQHGEVRVVNGEIHLEADKKFFLVTNDKYSDFELNVEIHLPEGKANSGVMFRCHVEPGKVFGYQAECDGSDRRWSGGLFDEGRRGWIWPSKDGKSKEKAFLAHAEESQAHMAKPEVAGALKRNGWNQYNITCKGNHIVIKLNGVTITDFKDDVDSEGHIGIQHHGEKGAVYRFRNIYLKEL